MAGGVVTLQMLEEAKKTPDVWPDSRDQHWCSGSQYDGHLLHGGEVGAGDVQGDWEEVIQEECGGGGGEPHPASELLQLHGVGAGPQILTLVLFNTSWSKEIQIDHQQGAAPHVLQLHPPPLHQAFLHPTPPNSLSAKPSWIAVQFLDIFLR